MKYSLAMHRLVLILIVASAGIMLALHKWESDVLLNVAKAERAAAEYKVPYRVVAANQRAWLNWTFETVEVSTADVKGMSKWVVYKYYPHDPVLMRYIMANTIALVLIVVWLVFLRR